MARFNITGCLRSLFSATYSAPKRTAAGYSFHEIAAFNKDQVAFLQPKEPYLAETVSEGTAIDPIVLLDLDIENLRVIYDEWTK